jgi:hypothetical protein
VYESERVVYNQPRSFREHLITVKEDFDPEALVKLDHPEKKKAMRVFKMNVVQRFDTENYPYSYLTSVFVKDEPLNEIVKLTVGSQEWCGNTFKLLKRNGEGASLTWHSYFENEADRTVDVALQKDDYFEDALPLSLRDLPFKEGYEKKVRVWSDMTNNHGQEPLVSSCTVRVEAEELIHCHAGSLPTWPVVVQTPTSVDHYWFEKAEPHILVKMERQDGSKRVLYARARWSYWDRRLPRPNVLN